MQPFRDDHPFHDIHFCKKKKLTVRKNITGKKIVMEKPHRVKMIQMVVPNVIVNKIGS